MYFTEKEINIRPDEPYEEIILPEGDRPWIGGINGTFYTIPRGERIKVPQNLAALIRQNERCTVLSVKSMEEYTQAEGKNLRRKGK